MAIFSEQEIENLMTHFDPKGSNGDSEAEVRRYIAWCEQARVDNALVDMLLNGSIRACFNSMGEVEFCLAKKA